MKTTYLYHSGFLVETNDCYYLFDYYKGDIPKFDTTKPILVFASHSHQDHYNPEVFKLLKEQGMEHITAVLSKDIQTKNYPECLDNSDIIRVTFHTQYELPCNTTLNTLHSTDKGVAFIIKCNDGVIYHAGDLNDWVWEGETEQYNRQMTGSYRHEINLLQKHLLETNENVDIAFIPLDSRQEKDYANGMLYFLKKIAVENIYPMHYWDKPQVIGQFIHEYPEYKDVIQMTEEL